MNESFNRNLKLMCIYEYITIFLTHFIRKFLTVVYKKFKK
jgi:hypothetical protein